MKGEDVDWQNNTISLILRANESALLPGPNFISGTHTGAALRYESQPMILRFRLPGFGPKVPATF